MKYFLTPKLVRFQSQPNNLHDYYAFMITHFKNIMPYIVEIHVFILYSVT